jgi:hypothetical protein
MNELSRLSAAEAIKPRAGLFNDLIFAFLLLFPNEVHEYVYEHRARAALGEIAPGP